MIDDLPEIPLVSKADYMKAVAAKGGDDEKVPTTPLAEMFYRCVSISSRYQKALEMEIMVLMVHALEGDAMFVESLFCDSKAQMNYAVRLVTGEQADGERIVRKLDEFLVSAYGGHNGIYLTGPGRVDASAGPNYREFEQDGAA